MDDVKLKWKGENPVEVGRIIFEQIPPLKRPAWVASILTLATSWIRHIPEIDYILAIAREPKEWNKGHVAFDQVRELTLINQDALIECLLLLAENTAKVIYNETYPRNPFDKDSGYWIAENLWAITSKINDPEFEQHAWSCLININY
ncbi:MAG: hypothetical protein SD837_07765 [Candidatus Electrothrix scaldis]|nr:MAG: hypothetical protein SD837_07765 [Candidatus Electrothrix sp. GW3-3]